MFHITGVKILAVWGDWGPFNFIKGLVEVVWMILQLLWFLIMMIFGLAELSEVAIIDAAHDISAATVGWVSDLLLLSPFSDSMLGGGGSLEQASVSKMSAMTGLTAAFRSAGMANLPALCIDAGLALTLIAFFYGFAESTVQIEKTNIQLIISRILRWIIACGLVSVSYLLFSYLFQAFRSLYAVGDISSDATSWYSSQLSMMKPASGDWISSTKFTDAESFFSMDHDIDVVLETASVGSMIGELDKSPIGMLILFFGLIKLIKKAIKFVIEQIPAFGKVVVYFLFAPLSLAMYASPETQQKANSYLRQFAGATLTNLFKVAAMAIATVIAMNVKFHVGSSTATYTVSVLNVMPVVSTLIANAFEHSSGWWSGSTLPPADLAKTIGFIVTSGGLLGYQLYFDMVGKASEVAERFAHEIMS